MAIKTWTGNGADNNWTTGGNWSGGTAPISGFVDDIVFDGVAVPNGNKLCIFNTAFSAISINFTGYTGEFRFAANLTCGPTTLGAGTTYTASGGNPTTYTFTARNVNSTFTANGKILPVNFATTIMSAGNTVTFAGNADFGGNFTTNSSGHNIKAATGTTVDLRIGGNISLAAITVNATDHVTIKGYGTGKTYGSNAASINIRCNFVSGSTYTSVGSSALSGTSFLTVEALGQFNAVSTHTFNNNGTTTLSGFNASNNSDFFAYILGTLVLSTDTVIKSYIQIQVNTMTITCSGASKLLLEGNFIATGAANTTIDRLEFSGTSTSNVTAVSNATNLQIKELIINKTGAGSVNFNSAGIFTLYIPFGNSYSWTHTSGTVTQNGTCIIRFSGQGTTSVMNYNATSPTPFTFRTVDVYGSSLSLNTTLNATTFKITPITTSSITSSAFFGFNTDQLIVVNPSVAARIIVLKSGVTYNINTQLVMSSPNGFIMSLNASAAPTRAIFNLDPAATQSVEYVSPDYIDSSGTGGVLPYTKQQIYSQNGTITATTINWSNTAQPPPVGAKITVGYTFVN
jgi:hypothetical protein